MVNRDISIKNVVLILYRAVVLSSIGLTDGYFGEPTTSGFAVLSAQSAMNFVSVQQIPEPTTAVLLVGGAAVAGLRGRVRRGLGKLLKGKADA